MRRKDIRPLDEDEPRLMEAGEEPAIRLPVPEKREYRQGLAPKPGESGAGPVQSIGSSEAGEPSGEADPEEAWEGHGPPITIPVGYLVLGAVFFFCVLVWTFALLLSAENPIVSEITEVENRRAEEAVESREAEGFVSRLEELTSRYLAAASIAEKAEFVRHRGRVEPLMEDYYSRQPLAPRKLAGISGIASVGLEMRPFIVLSVRLEDGEGPPVLTLILEETTSGDLRFDWEAEVAYQPIPLERYIEAQPLDPVDLRLFVGRDSFYCFEFSDERRHASFKLTERDSKEFLFGYAVRGSRVESDLEELLGDDPRAREPALLRVRFMPETSSIRSVLIEEVIAPRWSYLENPGEAR